MSNRRLVLSLACFGILGAVSGCDDEGMIVLMGGEDKKPAVVCNEGETRCEGELVQRCEKGEWRDPIECENGMKCNEDKCKAVGDAECSDESSIVCDGNSVKKCVDGKWKEVQKCDVGTECREGECKCIKTGKICDGDSISECYNGKVNVETCEIGCDVTLDDPKCYACHLGKVRCEDNRFDVCNGYEWKTLKDCNPGTCVADVDENGAYMACKCKNDKDVVCTGKEFDNVVCTDIEKYNYGDVEILYFYGESKKCPSGICENNVCIGAACLSGSEKCGDVCCGDGEVCKDGICQMSSECTSSECEGNLIKECKDGRLMDPRACGNGELCRGGECVSVCEPACKPDVERCMDGKCVCNKDASWCEESVLVTCDENGDRSRLDCLERKEKCSVDRCECNPGSTRCNVNTGEFEYCNNKKEWKILESCGVGKCIGDQVDGVLTACDCVMGEGKCEDGKYMKCNRKNDEVTYEGGWMKEDGNKCFGNYETCYAKGLIRCKMDDDKKRKREICKENSDHLVWMEHNECNGEQLCEDGGVCVKKICNEGTSVCATIHNKLRCEKNRYISDSFCGDKCAMQYTGDNSQAYCVKYDDKCINGFKRCSGDSNKSDVVKKCVNNAWSDEISCNDNEICGYADKDIKCVKKTNGEGDDKCSPVDAYKYKCSSSGHEILYCDNGKWIKFANCNEVGLECEVANEVGNSGYYKTIHCVDK